MHQQVWHSTIVRSAQTVFMCFVFICNVLVKDLDTEYMNQNRVCESDSRPYYYYGFQMLWNSKFYVV